MTITTNTDNFNCKTCIHFTDSKGKTGCSYFGLNSDEINGRYKDETREGKKGVISNEDLRRRFGIHIPRESTTITGDRLLKDFTIDGLCTAHNDGLTVEEII